ncbi:MAG: hypothetical protein ACM3JF_02785 [Sphaerimonospora mesophila]
MILVGFLTWWYGAGWHDQIKRIGLSVRRTSDFFSISLLARTLFALFRQISADATGNDIASRFRAWGDRMFSRIIGAVMRIFMIVFGIIALGLTLVISLVRLALWPAVPLLPLAGLVLMLSIGAPWKLV